MADDQASRGKLWTALAAEQPLQIAGTINAYSALLAEHAGFRAIYLSGSGIATASFGKPDLGIIAAQDVVEDSRRIAGASDLPLLVDIDTGWGSLDRLADGIRDLAAAGVAAVHMEDQPHEKRCGHRPGKSVVSIDEMNDRIKAAVDARPSDGFVVMARTDAVSVEGMDAAIERAGRYVDAGADMIFAEALSSLDDYQRFTTALKVPVLANATEFGKTPLFTVDQYRSVGIGMVLYPLSAFRAMSKAALTVYQTIRTAGTQQDVLADMQTREELYEHLDYYAQEQSRPNN